MPTLLDDILLESKKGHIQIRFGGAQPANGTYRFDYPSFATCPGTERNTEYTFSSGGQLKSFDIAENTGQASRTGTFSFSATTAEDSQYDGTVTVVCAWTVTQKPATQPITDPEPCTFTFELNGTSFIQNNSQYNVVLYDDGTDRSFTMVASNGEGSMVNTGFEANSTPPTQTSNIFVTKATDIFDIQFDGDETTKEMQVRYVFSGDLENATSVSLIARFKNLTTPSADKVLEMQSGSGYYKYLDLDDWYISNGLVQIQVSFEIYIA